jgi:hypothetical protein
MLNAFQKFALMSTKMCQYNENKSCLNEFAETNEFFFYGHLDNNCKSNLSSISLQSDSLLYSNLYFSLFRIIHCNTETFKIQNGDHFYQLIMDALMQNPFKFQSAAGHFRHKFQHQNC